MRAILSEETTQNNHAKMTMANAKVADGCGIGSAVAGRQRLQWIIVAAAGEQDKGRGWTADEEGGRTLRYRIIDMVMFVLLRGIVQEILHFLSAASCSSSWRLKFEIF